MLRFKTFLVVDSKVFAMGMNIAVTINTIILCLDGFNVNSTLLNDFNVAFTILFTIELGLKIIGLGIMKYIKDPMNVFDALIVALSLIDLFFLSGSSVFKSVKIFRALRVLRVTKLMR
jgi:hypothetical protein